MRTKDLPMTTPPFDALVEFPLFHPVSEGDDQIRSALTLLSIKQTIPNLEALIHQLGLGTDIPDLANFTKTETELEAARKLGKLFDHYGSDKASAHNYNFLYGPMLASCTGSGVLEIGIGSSNTSIVSNMGAGHQPGGSLRAFRDFTQAPIYGADFDKEALFSENLVNCFFVDQTKPSSFLELDFVVPNGLDLVIDDGLHAPNANLATLAYGLKKVREGGWVVIEDIGLSAVPLWQVVYAIISRGLECYLLRAKVHFVFAVRKSSPR